MEIVDPILGSHTQFPFGFKVDFPKSWRLYTLDRTYRIEKEESGILLGNRRRKDEEKEINESTELLSFRFFSSHFKLPEKLEDRKKSQRFMGLYLLY